MPPVGWGQLRRQEVFVLVGIRPQIVEFFHATDHQQLVGLVSDGPSRWETVPEGIRIGEVPGRRRVRVMQ